MARLRHKRRSKAEKFLSENALKIAVIAVIILMFVAVFVYRACADAKRQEEPKGNPTTSAEVEIEVEGEDKAISAGYTGDIEYHHTKFPGTTVITDDPRVYIVAQLIWGEARGVTSTTEQAAVAWCVLNRVDDPMFPDTIEGVITQECQFDGYLSDNPAEEEFIFLAADVIHRWQEEKKGHPNVGRVLPATYLYFEGDGERNWFTEDWLSDEFFDWTLPTPYED